MVGENTTKKSVKEALDEKYKEKIQTNKINYMKATANALCLISIKRSLPQTKCRIKLY